MYMSFRPEFYLAHHELLPHIFEMYAREPRLYHTLHHVNKMLEGYNRLTMRGVIEYRELDILIILMHDYIYDIGRRDNELQSACVAERWLEDRGYSKTDQKYVFDGICATSTHEATGDDNIDMILDLDCEYLSYEKDQYNLCVAGIRYEYLTHIEERYWTAGRKNFLQSMLDRSSIYLTDYFRETRELNARVNMTRELEGL